MECTSSTKYRKFATSRKLQLYSSIFICRGAVARAGASQLHAFFQRVIVFFLRPSRESVQYLCVPFSEGRIFNLRLSRQQCKHVLRQGLAYEPSGPLYWFEFHVFDRKSNIDVDEAMPVDFQELCMIR